MPTGAATSADVLTRFNREDHKRTKHDSHFSKWKILIGPRDWEDHSVGKGVARYRVENLPKSSSSGLYELAIYRTHSSTRDHLGKLDPDRVLVVYLGEADNVRTRLQQYGRTGSHLGRNGSGDKGCGCFEDIFARGYSIVYRWAPKWHTGHGVAAAILNGNGELTFFRCNTEKTEKQLAYIFGMAKIAANTTFNLTFPSAYFLAYFII
ncbi:hypothetical protein V6N13_050990 [Hibiscus sabdariffa]|uniref:Protein EFFECTOR OF TRANSCRIPTION 2-like n=1 Tax=Hibiscus sabdariffa TaxID=183260 RepID=A0ABR2T280_9ROSI